MAKQTGRTKTSKVTAVRPGSKNDSANSKKTKSASVTNDRPILEKFFLDELKDIYWAEKHLVKALGKLKKAATTEELQQAFEDHTAATEEHIKRLEQVFGMLGTKAQAKKCEAMDGLTKEGESIIEQTEPGTMTRDVGLIMAAQKVEHYEIATYGSLVQLANTMNLEEIAEILEQTLQEEKDTDNAHLHR
jgi:ferritin-like metal-binding protein YciE